MIAHREAGARGLPWGVWAFGPDFHLYDHEKGRWDADLLEAVIPGRP